jgi:hypothetical protein
MDSLCKISHFRFFLLVSTYSFKVNIKISPKLTFHRLYTICRYMDEIDRISEPDYVPSHGDILRAHENNTVGGIIEEAFMVDGVNFEMYDVGNQKNNQRKWIHCFDEITGIIFVVDLSEYDRNVTLKADPSSTNSLNPSSLENRHLPRELLLKIKEFVSREDVKTMRKVCKFWYEVCHLRVSRMEQLASSFGKVMLFRV